MQKRYRLTVQFTQGGPGCTIVCANLACPGVPAAILKGESIAMPPKKMIITQNLVFNIPLAVIMNFVSTLTNPKVGFDISFIPMTLIGFVLVEILGFIIPIQKIAGAVGGKIAPRKNPMEFPQFFAVAAVITVILTVFMTAGMTFFGMLFGGEGFGGFPMAFLMSLPVMLITAYVCVLIFMPVSMKVSGLGEFAAKNQGH